MVKVVNRWRQMAADITVGAASLVSFIAASAPRSPYGRLREFTDEESNLCLLFNRVVDIENPERHTVYLVISLFVSFLSNKNSTPTDEKANAKKQSLLFRHFNTLLGFSNTEKCFTIPPYRFDQVPISDGIMRLINIVSKTLQAQAHACCETDQPTDIATWDDISEDESESPKGMIRPESLTVTTIQEHEGEVTLHPTIIEPRPMRKRSEAVRRKEPRKQRKPATNLIDHPIYPWHDSEMFVPGNCRSVAKQMLRVTLHQLSSSGICMQLFDTPLSRSDSFWKVVSVSLADFQELSPVYFIQLLFEDLSENWLPRLSTTMRNLAAYIVEVPSDAYINHWSTAITHMESFFRRYHTQISVEGAAKPSRSEVESAIVVMSHVLKVQNFSAFKERDKQSVSRAVVAEMIQAIKFKCPMHEANFITIAHLILQDAGEDIEMNIQDDQFNTAASEAVRPFLFEILDFIADLHVLAKLKKETNSDSVGGDLKVKLAEAIAVEMSRSNARDCRTVIRFIPWLMSPPSVTQMVYLGCQERIRTQAAPGAFADSVTNVRVLSWLLLGALHANHGCLPVPIECSQHMADYIHFVLAGFADQSKQSVVHMSALFHAFHLCQLWTVYCERAAVFRPHKNPPRTLLAQEGIESSMLADMVNLHFLNTIQALQQVNSALLCQLYPMWAPILTAYHSQIPHQLRIKLDSCENQPSLSPPPLSDWLKKVRYKISQVELQTSAASPYYNV
ncbi:hypothetical protein TELCIR_02878 [Teladorsagia circumcincta]|uniref:Uncharacterized protein n=2 Tax=Teladorsagia circumcincta TaxID=45464 RepID=A0A2G9UXV5_TELCI|nr:hypothetical protein TELCIR_02878 [Teladorsagia circumcincta]